MTHPLNKSKILKRAWAIVRIERQAAARAHFYAQYEITAGQIAYVGKSQAELFAATKIDLSAAMKRAWAEAKAPKIDAVLASITSAYLAKIAA